MTGTPVSSPTRIKPCETASQMYSKCMVEPLMRTPMAMTASKGCLDILLVDADVEGVAGEGSRREAVLLIKSFMLAEAWSWDAAISLFSLHHQHVS